MSLLNQIDKFFEDKSNDLEEEIQKLTELLHQLIDKVYEDDGKKLNQQTSSLEAILDCIKENKNKDLREEQDRQELTKLYREARQIINNFRHGEILRKYREKHLKEESTPRTKLKESPISYSGDDQAKINRGAALPQNAWKRAADLAKELPGRAISVHFSSRGEQIIRIDPDEFKSDTTPSPSSYIKLVKGGK